MKKIVFSAVSALAFASFAADSTQFGVLTVPSTAAQTIVSVPWLASATNDTAVKVADLVLTAGLNAKDELKYYNGSKYACWILEEGEGGVKHWVASTTVSLEGVGTVEAEQDAALARGRAIILKRGTPIASQFYIMGKPTSAVGEVSLGTGYSLIAPPFVADTDVNSLEWTNINGRYDTLLIPDSSGGFTSLAYKNPTETSKGMWRKWTGSVWTTENLTIPAGTGAWFSSRDTTSTASGKKVSWTAKQVLQLRRERK